MKTLLTLSIILSALFGYSQECGTVEPPNTLILSPQMSLQLAADPTIRTIPIVFHIVWNPTLFPGDSANVAGKLANYQSIMQKFLRKQNADTAQTVPAFRSVMTDAKIEFCLKQVIYKRTTEASFTTNDKIKFEPTGSPAVDPNKHCNIWLGRLTGSLGGYAYFPQAAGHPFDGLVALLPSSHSDETVAEIIVHELLHYLGVYHTFQGGSCTGDGDFCGDTPPTNTPSGCNLSTSNCGTLTQVQNVMDYAHCATGLTVDQSARMTATLIGIRNQLWNSGTCSGTPGNTPPTCSITFPTNNQTFPAPANININVSATDANGTVTKVEFYQGTTLLNTDQTQPYSFVWQGVTQGTYTLTARATDNGGATTTSSVVNITVGTSTAPVCNLVSPVNGANYIMPATVKMEATATDADGIAKVEFSLNNSWLTFPLTSPPYVIYWQAYAGTHTIKARATDKTGAVTVSQTATIIVTNQGNTPPVVSITAPVNNATFTAPASIPITVTATDNTGVNRVEFYNGNSRLGTDNTAPYALTWNSVAAGNYTLTARAYDTQGASSVSSPVSIVVKSGVTDSPVKEIILLQNNSLKFKAEDGRERTIP